MDVGVIGSGSIGPDLAYGFVSALAAQKSSRVFLLDIRKEHRSASVPLILRTLVGKTAAPTINTKAASKSELLAALKQTFDYGEAVIK